MKTNTQERFPAEMWDKMQYILRNYYDGTMHSAFYYDGTLDEKTYCWYQGIDPPWAVDNT